MGTIKGMFDRIAALDTNRVAANAIEETKETIEELNLEQMFSGLNSDGSEISPPYKEFTVAMKKRKGQPYDRVTLKDTGSFYQGIRTEIVGNKVITDSTDSKSDKLQEKYGQEIFGLGTVFKSIYVNETLRPAFSRNIEMMTGLKMK